MEEQAEIYTYLPHDLMSDINIQSDNTDVDTPFEPKLTSSKTEKLSIKDKTQNFTLGNLSIDSSDYNSNFFLNRTKQPTTQFKTTSIPILSIQP